MFCTQPFNHIDVVVENDKVLLQPCNVWTAKKLNINEYKNNIQEVKDTIWSKIPQSEYEDPPEEWIPEDPNYRLWHETGDITIKGSLTKSKNSI